MPSFKIDHGNCVDHMKNIPESSIDAIICDPPYPEINRPYGKIKESDWHEMMDKVVIESKRVLKPKGSAVFILQPNYDKIGKTRIWLWEFLVRAAKSWNLVEDVYWWNISAIPNAGCERKNGLLRRSVKSMIWLGEPDCYRCQDNVLRPMKQSCIDEMNRGVKDERYSVRSGNGMNKAKLYAGVVERGGVTPFNLIDMGAGGSNAKHPACTPMRLCEWWVRYICPKDGVVLDPFMGTGNVGIAALNFGCNYHGIEQFDDYIAIAEERLKNPTK